MSHSLPVVMSFVGRSGTGKTNLVAVLDFILKRMN